MTDVRSITLACLLSLIALAAPARAADAPAVAAGKPPAPFLGGFIESSRITYPTGVAGWQAVREHRFDEPGAGVSIRFQAESTSQGWMDVYVYPAGVIDAGRFEALAARERDGVIGAGGAQSMLRDVDAGPLVPLPLALASAARGPDATAVPAHVFDLAGSRDGERVASVMAIALDRMYFVKLRYTVQGEGQVRETARRTAEAFFDGLLAKLSITSTGGCWRVPAIVTRAGPLDANAPGALVSMSTDDAVSGVAFADRVEVVEGAPDAAHISPVLQALASQMSGEAFDGCIAPDPQEPAVEEGMREIRIDYRLPDGNGRKRQVSPRVTRSGIG